MFTTTLAKWRETTIAAVVVSGSALFPSKASLPNLGAVGTADYENHLTTVLHMCTQRPREICTLG